MTISCTQSQTNFLLDTSNKHSLVTDYVSDIIDALHMHFSISDAHILIILILLMGKLRLKEVLSFAQGSLLARGGDRFHTQRPKPQRLPPLAQRITPSGITSFYNLREKKRESERRQEGGHVLYSLLFLSLAFYIKKNSNSKMKSKLGMGRSRNRTRTRKKGYICKRKQ